MSLERVALGILEVSDAAMERAIRVISVERGHDPRDCALLAFGGAGPLHAVSVARRLSIPRVIIPSTAGVLSAFGLLTAEAGHDESRSLVRALRDLTEEELHARISELEEAGAAKMRSEGIGEDAIRFRISADLRYLGQSHELNVGYPEVALARRASLDRLAEAFHREHEARFGHAAPDEEIELITLRVRAFAAASPIEFTEQSQTQEAEWVAEVWFTPDGPSRTRCIPRGAIRADEAISGPAILFGTESTILVPDGCEGRQDRHGVFIVEVR
jgi:N-methylhydantoinase A